MWLENVMHDGAPVCSHYSIDDLISLVNTDDDNVCRLLQMAG
jgi:hypothetical protein